MLSIVCHKEKKQGHSELGQFVERAKEQVLFNPSFFPLSVFPLRAKTKIEHVNI
jgi:hypothetical protein